MAEKNIKFLGVDIGGAHLKIVGLDREKNVVLASQIKCPVWKGTNHIEKNFNIIKKIAPRAILGITMTAELCDNFSNRDQGVKEIINITKKIKNVKYFFTSKKKKYFEKVPNYRSISSMNWLATSRFMEKKISDGLVVDFGSTTTDLTLIKNYRCKNQYTNDFSRINNAELIYTGLTRTPIMALAEIVNINKKLKVNIIPELFSNTSDLYRVLGILPINVDLYESLDGRNKSKINCFKRLSRNFGLDYKRDNRKLIINICKKIFKIQIKKIHNGIKTLLNEDIEKRKVPLIICGIGKKILKDYFKEKYTIIDFSDYVSGSYKMRLLASYHAPATSCALLISELNNDLTS